jgi:hypothetical protein
MKQTRPQLRSSPTMKVHYFPPVTHTYPHTHTRTYASPSSAYLPHKQPPSFSLSLAVSAYLHLLYLHLFLRLCSLSHPQPLSVAALASVCGR